MSVYSKGKDPVVGKELRWRNGKKARAELVKECVIRS